MPLPVLLLAAITAGVLTDIGWWQAVAVAAVAGAYAVVAPRVHWRWCLAVAAAGMCCAHAATRRDAVLASPLVTALGPLLDDRAAPPVHVSGVLRDDASAEADRVLLAVDVDRMRVARVWRPIRGRALISVGGTLASPATDTWTRGRRVTAPALVRRPQIWRNPGSPSERWQRLGRASDIVGSVKSAALVTVEPGTRLSEWAAYVRRHVRRTLVETVGRRSRRSAGIVTAILIGDRTGLDDETIRRLQMAGTYHVIAISGGNIAIVVVACLALLRAFLRSPRVIAVIALAVVLAYGGVVGDQASVSRAVTAAAVVLGLEVAGRYAPVMRIFLAAALIVAIADPLAVIDVGAWLSFGATLGIVLLSGRMMRWIPRGTHWFIVAAGGLLAATIAAELALLPVGAAVFARVSAAGLVLNFVAIPAMTIAQLAGTVTVVAAPLWPALAEVAAWLADGGAVVLVRSADLLTVLPWLSWQTPPVGWAWIVIYYAGAALALWAGSLRWARRAGTAASAVSLTVILWAPNWLPRAAPPGWLRVVMLDVGQGESMAVTFPSGQSLLVDAGGSGGAFDVGARVVEPALWALGIRHLDWLALTHGDIDHVGGAASVMRDLRPREVWEGVPVPRDARMQALRTRAQAQGAVWRRLLAGHAFEVGSVLVDVLNPPPPDWERQDTRNDDSLLLRLRFGEVSLLLTGDIGQAVEDGLTPDRVPRLRLLTMPHHGSRSSSSAPFVRGWLPHAVFVSAGRANSFGHPAPDVMARYAQFGVEVFRTDRDGAIVIDTDGRRVQVRTKAGRVWQLTYAVSGSGGER